MFIEMEKWFEDCINIAPGIEREWGIKKLAGMRSRGDSWFIWVENNECIAWVLVMWKGKKTEPDYPDMLMLHVKESHRRKGIANKIVLVCEDHAKLLGYKRIGLSVDAIENHGAVKLYKNLGYSNTNREPYFIQGENNLITDMVKEL